MGYIFSTPVHSLGGFDGRNPRDARRRLKCSGAASGACDGFEASPASDRRGPSFSPLNPGPPASLAA